MISRLITILQESELLLSDQEIAAFSEAQSVLHDEDIADALWLAARIGGAYAVSEPAAIDEISESEDAIAIEVIDDNTVVVAPPPMISAYMPPAAKPDSGLVETPESGLPIQVQAAPALAHPREISRSLRPLMRKMPSLTRSELDESATVNRIAERDIWLPILKPSPERWFDLELVIEASQFSFIWQETLDEFQQLLRGQGAFRNVRTWFVKEAATGQPQLVAKQPQGSDTDQDLPLRSHKELVDVSGRRLVLFISDCRSRLWRQGQIHDWLTLWSQHGPAAIVQLLPERLWSQSELDVGFAVQVGSLLPGAPNPKLQVRELPARTEIAPADTLTVPIVTLTAKALKQWALVVAAAGRQRSPARLFDLSWVQDPDRDRSVAVIRPQAAKERVELFMATASPVAQRLACMMAAVPVELPVVHLIQQELLPEVQSVHIAEVYTSSLLEGVKPNPAKPDAPARYDFVKEVRGLLNEITPLDETLGVLEALSQRIARTLGFEIKSFTALLSPKSGWSQEARDAILPFAQIATEVLHRLGGDYAELAQLVEQDAKGYPDWIQPLESEPVFPGLEVLEFTMAQLVDSSAETLFPPLQTQEVEVVTIALDDGLVFFDAFGEGAGLEDRTITNDEQDITAVGVDWQLIEFEVATLERNAEQQRGGLFGIFQRGEQRSQWVIRKQRQQRVGLWVEPLGNEMALEMLLISRGTFVMGSPEAESARDLSEGPQHEVGVETFVMSKDPITQAQWKAVTALPQINQELYPNPSRFKGDKHPVEQVTWYEAVEFCNRLSAHTGREYRLPSEAEWEYACRAGTTTPFSFGETVIPDLANYDSQNSYIGSPKVSRRWKTVAVDHFDFANHFGLRGMHGNVWEWCQDNWHDNYEGAPNNEKAWLMEYRDASRIGRGGAWDDPPENCRSACRASFNSNLRRSGIGFRVVFSNLRLFRS